MGRISEAMTERVGRYLWESGRVLEQRRFETAFGGAGPQGLAAALEAYRTPDGGYAYGLEPDVRGPAPQPIAVPSALRVLAEAGEPAGARVRGICDWLTGVTAPDGGVAAVLPTLSPYPHPPFLPLPRAPVPPGDLLTTGQIAGPLLRHRVEHPWLAGATAFCRNAIEALTTTHPIEAEAALTFLDACPDRAWARRQGERLGTLVRDQRLVLLDPSRPDAVEPAPGYAPGELHLPHDYAPHPGSTARGWFSDAELGAGLDHLAAGQLPDGGWPVRWALWSASTENEARPGVTLEALLILRAHDNAG